VADNSIALDLDVAPATFESGFSDYLVFKPSTGISDRARTAQAVTGAWANWVDVALKRLQAKITGTVINVREHGAQGNGVTNDTVAIQAALTRAGTLGGAVVFLPAGTYPCTAQLTIPNGVHLAGAGVGATVLSFAGASAVNFPNLACLYSEGALVALPDLGADVIANASTVTFASPPALAANDIFCIYNTTDYSFNASRSYYRAGEWKRVIGLAGSLVTCDTPAYEAYTAGSNIDLYRLDPTSAGVADLEIRGLGATSTVAVIKASLGRACSFSNLRLSGTQYIHIALDRCVSTIISGCHVFDNGAAAGLNYGVAVLNSYRTIIDACDIYTTRHCITHGGSSVAGAVPSRKTIVDGCHLTSSFLAFDAHGNTEWYTVSDTTIDGGAALAGDHAKLSGCTITNRDICPALIFGENVGVDFEINDCTFREVSSVWPTFVEWSVGTDESGALRRPGGTFRFIDCKFELINTPYPIAMRNRHASVFDISLEITGCNFRRPGMGTTNPYVWIESITLSAWKNIDISDVISDGVPFFISTGMRRFTSKNVKVHGAPHYGIRLNRTGVSAADFPWGGADGRQRIVVSDCEVIDCAHTGVSIAAWYPDTSTIIVNNSTMVRNGTTNPGGSSNNQTASFFVSNAGHAKITGNTIGDDRATPLAQRVYGVNAITLLEEHDNLRVGSLATVNETTVTQRISGVRRAINNRVNYETMSTAAPTTGTWARGDVCWNGDAAVGAPVGWICTVAGTPGTWVALANL
jgi:Pectate lyase superfamily protein